jgi:hypothetical protein
MGCALETLRLRNIAGILMLKIQNLEKDIEPEEGGLQRVCSLQSVGISMRISLHRRHGRARHCLEIL